MSIDPTLFRQVLSRFASGVTVVTTAVENELFGITVSAFCSVSLEPPLVLVCIGSGVAAHTAISTAGKYAVNILSEEQEDLSRRFADPRVDQFLADSYLLSPRGLPLLRGALATLECRVVQTFPSGDHTICVGEVEAAATGNGQPLLYYRSGYRQLG